MSLANEVTPVKDECLKRALGLSGRQPKMAQHKA